MTLPEQDSSHSPTHSAWSWTPAKERVQLQQRIADLIEAARIERSCLTCMHFDEKNELCHLAHQRPPARVIALGCESFLMAPPF